MVGSATFCRWTSMHAACTISVQMIKLYIFVHNLFFITGGIVAAVCTCQVEVVLVAIVTGLVVYFVTKRAVKQKPNSSHDRSGNTAEPTGLVKKHVTYESASDGDATGYDIVEMQPSPAYHSIPQK